MLTETQFGIAFIVTFVLLLYGAADRDQRLCRNPVLNELAILAAVVVGLAAFALVGLVIGLVGLGVCLPFLWLAS